MEIKQYEIYLVNLDPTVGSEIKKTRPCVVLSPNEMNKHIQPIMIAPMTTMSHPYPTRVPFTLQGKSGWIVLDQIRTVDRIRLVKRVGALNERAVQSVKKTIKEMLVD